jgi:hypothetical protein
MRSFALAVLVLVSTPLVASAQTSPVSRVDLTVAVGSFSSRHAELNDYDRWAHGFFRSLAAGYYWNDHLKTEAEVAWTGPAEGYGSEQLRAGSTYVFVPLEHRYRNLILSVSQAYQFGRNARFHPFIAGGIDIDRQDHRIDRGYGTLSGPIGVPGRVPVAAFTDDRSVHARPFGATGFKAYMTDRAFFRSDLKLAFERHIEQVTWRVGFGVDF